MPLRPTVHRQQGYKPAPRQPKRPDPHYLTPEHKAWAADVIARAGGSCEWVESGRRCTKSAPEHRMIADHVIELADRGPKLGKGQCLCVAHNTLKAAQMRQRRAAPQGWDAMHDDPHR